MIYQVRVIMFLEDEPYARGLYNHCKGIFPRAVSINPDKQNAEFSVIELIENNHDRDSAAPCLLLAGITTRPSPP